MIKDLEVLLPTCTMINEPDLLRITIKAWMIARFSSINRVDKITLYKSRKGRSCTREADILKKLLIYYKTPPYLKKKVHGRSEELKYVGLAPPLQIPTHNVSSKPLEGEEREALVVRKRGIKLVLDAGFPNLLEALDYEKRYSKGDIVLVRVVSEDPPKIELVGEPQVYRGYNVSFTEDLVEYVESNKDRYWIATSRRGRASWKYVGLITSMIEEKSGRVSVVMGEPYRGIFEIGRELGFEPQLLFDDVLNFIPEQGTKSVRVEEALGISLSILRFLDSSVFGVQGKRSEITK